MAEVQQGMDNLSVKENVQKPAAPKKEKKKAPQGNPLLLDPQPEFLDHRIKIFDEIKAKYDAEIAAKERVAIKITLKDGSIKEGTAFETSPFDIASSIGKSFLERQVISKVDGELWDLERPFESDATLEFLDFEHPEGKAVFWHSSAHVLGEACECHYGCHLSYGPPTEDGFFYDMSIRDGSGVVSQDDFGNLEKVSTKVIKEKQKFIRLEMTKDELLKMFAYNKYKVRFISEKVPDNTSTTVYRCGPLIDLCRGPHILHTGKIKAFKVLKNSSSYFLGDAANDSLQRVYGISFPDKKLMDEHLKFLKEASERDHRKIGKEQELFYFNEMSPGSAFWLPHGTRIYNTLVDMLKSEYRQRGYDEVITPNMYNTKLWETSGHWENYKENMFAFEVEKETFGLKPMNCPGHCILFKSRERSYRELPWRVADFGVVHRNEFSGALSGLTRVRRFQQDDAHIFCQQEQIELEIAGVFDFLQKVYGTFGFEFKMELSTRPEKYVGDLETWNNAEKNLENALNKFMGEGKWELNPADGAFYGPKIDIKISDALKRWFQCATIQLDFQMPARFGLEFKSDTNEKENALARPVMIHRAILGSVERMTAILTEHYKGKWPFWLSPRQILIVPVGAKYIEYAESLKDELVKKHHFFADADVTGNTLQKKVRNGQLLKYNFIFIVGEQEQNEHSVNVRNRDIQEEQGKNATIKFEDVVKQLHKLKEEMRQDNKLN
ncbi:threonyl-tRNA synthetase [Metschnikowia bicuspidata var. bicuspidata NRRL YB-4993]|uniref:Threonine--tRNA ligase, cytoplasmic n=1 Tax=Metschnikowia bicuspidata var. bicuspidata NRRL YB-4993 TaxID=869754 RepID=A0A1A0H824_9ASCO|nr:threonyl-tRNA synthetase [Metschnikowia bicuspidata var. bicuspidata NRRL YB-4993]OBA20048.1 threonyl-tRNA synthetase [Metschnikowia bicuspidata var. bicuspidata NRRL YB-4993]